MHMQEALNWALETEASVAIGSRGSRSRNESATVGQVGREQWQREQEQRMAGAARAGAADGRSSGWQEQQEQEHVAATTEEQQR